MSMLRNAILITICICLCQLVRADPVSFDRNIQPILHRCIHCHGPDKPDADLDLTSFESAVDIGAIVSRNASASELIARVTSNDPDIRMPPDGQPLSDTEIESLRAWIDDGADWPTHWAYRELVAPALPHVNDVDLRDWCCSPIDRFIAAKLEHAGLSASSRADRRTLLRRLYVDVIGMVPTANEVTRFENDHRPDAYQRVVDQLLGSPQYGERWARHWMDIVHFAETHGHDQDRIRENAWPYRDYLITRLNADTSYDQFVREQIAGDAISPDDPWSIVATGFLAAGPWDESTLRDIQEGSIDREIGRYLDRDDIVTTVMSTFASTSVHCARCHDHKFDPVSQDQYYGLQAVFAGIDKANRKYEPDQQVADQRRRWNQRKRELATWLAQQDRQLIDASNQAIVAAWESQQLQTGTIWKPLELIEVVSSGDSQLLVQPDNSVYADGTRPDKETYTVLARTSLSNVQAIRLSVLADQRLPMQGPGRQDNGNLHLNEIRFFDVDESDLNISHPIAVASAVADFDQAGWTIAMSVDKNPATAWGIYPEVGKSHFAVFEFDDTEQRESDSGQLIRIEMDQIHGGGHLIGRFELSATNQTGPLTVQSLIPGKIAAIIAMHPSQRSEDQKMQLAAYVLDQQADAQLAALPVPAMVYCGTNDFQPDGSFRPTNHPRIVSVLGRGDIANPIHEATPTALTCVDGLSIDTQQFDQASESDRRIALANWIADKRNGLAWRSIANRVWHYHFGQAIVDTLNDFGHAGSSPTHRQLLDWLAMQLQRGDGSLKTLHREILTSAAYQQSSAHHKANALADSTNRLVWRMNRRRLDAESFRDSMLRLSQSLDYRMGGPSDRQFNTSPGVHVTPVVDYMNFDVNNSVNYRRSVYRFIFRTIPDPLMSALDCPDASQLAPQRGESVTAIQTLGTMNDKFVIRQSELLAQCIESQQAIGAAEIDAQAESAYRILFGRSPSLNERTLVARYAEQHGWANACRLLLNTNEFMFVD